MTERPPLLVALCSPAMGSGKTTAAQHLIHDHGFVKIAFADPLKKMTIALLQCAGMDEEEITARVYGARKEETIPLLDRSSRYLQQVIGTEFGRELVHPDIWIKIAMAAVDQWHELGFNVVVDDMRFANELEAVRAAGGHPLRIFRPGCEVTRSHASEGALDHETMPQIVNDSTIPVLTAQVDAWLASL